MSILFINGGEKDGNTARMGRELIGERDYVEIDLADTKVYDYGQVFDDDDQFDEVIEAVRAADTIVMGSPVYWHNLSGMMRNLLDRFYGPVPEKSLSGRRLFFIFQGAAPTPDMLKWGEYTMNRFANLYGMEYMGMATSDAEARKMGERL
ncbi:flavodoxin family protein [uncultured Adlercreutzia sp.]|uniref:flavodoxin family protein n=1 Tax=uncultured Adlercreutzia sp. TaxID=875803 RepID=UPI0026770784|nr:NAD(P)H-dependent oxidoreductase [uncultured Adlercreutzia sp.]